MAVQVRGQSPSCSSLRRTATRFGSPIIPPVRPLADLSTPWFTRYNSHAPCRVHSKLFGLYVHGRTQNLTSYAMVRTGVYQVMSTWMRRVAKSDVGLGFWHGMSAIFVGATTIPFKRPTTYPQMPHR